MKRFAMAVFVLLAAIGTPAFAQSADESATGRNVDALHKAMVA